MQPICTNFSEGLVIMPKHDSGFSFEEVWAWQLNCQDIISSSEMFANRTSKEWKNTNVKSKMSKKFYAKSIWNAVFWDTYFDNQWSLGQLWKSVSFIYSQYVSKFVNSFGFLRQCGRKIEHVRPIWKLKWA